MTNREEPTRTLRNEVGKNDMRERLDRILREQLRAIMFIAGLYHAAMAPIYAQTLDANHATTMMILAALSGAVSFALWWGLQPGAARVRRAHPVLALQFGLTLANHLTLISLTDNFRQTTHIMLLLIVIGMLTLSKGWFSVFTLSAWGGWAIVVPGSIRNEDWQHFALGMLFATAVAVAAHILHRQAGERLVRAEDRSKQQQDTIDRYDELLETSIEIGQRINASPDLDTMLNHVVEIIKIHLDCIYVGILLLDKNHSELVTRAGTGNVGHIALRRSAHIGVGKGIIGWVAKTLRSAYVANTVNDSRFVAWDLLPDTSSEAALPLKINDRLLGVLDLQSDRINAFRPSDLSTLHLLSDQIAFAIQNALLEQREEQHHRLADALYNIGRALARPMDRQRAFDLILHQLVSVIPHDRGAVLLRNGNVLELVATRGFPSSKAAFQWRIPIRPGDVFNEIQHTQRPLILADALQRSDWFHLEDILPARSWMGVPLIHGDDVVGMLSLARETHAPYTEDDITFAATFAVQAMIAIENADLHSKIDEF